MDIKRNKKRVFVFVKRDEEWSLGEEVARVDDITVKALGYYLLVLHIERV